jgi:murein tripeptide amidase MpaA
LGKTPEKRNIWLVTLTDKDTAPHTEKPAYWIDGCIHAVELSGCQAAVHTLDHLVKNWKKSKEIKKLLATTTIYMAPMISPDGVEYVFRTGINVRSTNKKYLQGRELNGLCVQDINDDGQVLTMRIEDPNGFWRASKKDSRLLVPRKPDESEETETYYRLLPEGLVKNWDGSRLRISAEQGLDFNRQFPMNWQPEGIQSGAGKFPLSEAETMAVVKAISDRPNISGIHSYHTFSGVILRPSCNKVDAELPDLDKNMFVSIGKRGEELTGYPCLSLHHDFRYHPKREVSGSFLDWSYEHQGILSFCIEIWNIANRVGIKIDRSKHIESLFHGFSEEENLKIIKWCDANLKKGSYFYDWKEFEHPQLGRVEIGGWKTHEIISNPPGKFLKEEVHKNMLFSLACAKTLPRVEVKEKKVEKIADEAHKVEVTICNVGYMPTYGTAKAKQIEATPAPKVKLKLGKGLKLIEGDLEHHIEHLEGRSADESFHNQLLGGYEERLNESRHVFIISGRGKVEITFSFPRAGTKRLALEL